MAQCASLIAPCVLRTDEVSIHAGSITPRRADQPLVHIFIVDSRALEPLENADDRDRQKRDRDVEE